MRSLQVTTYIRVVRSMYSNNNKLYEKNSQTIRKLHLHSFERDYIILNNHRSTLPDTKNLL